MKIIRDEELSGIMMIPLMVEWGVKRCNVDGCKEKPNTIVLELHPKVPIAGFCEKHFQEANVPGGADMRLIFDDFDAFAQEESTND